MGIWFEQLPIAFIVLLPHKLCLGPFFVERGELTEERLETCRIGSHKFTLPLPNITQFGSGSIYMSQIPKSLFQQYTEFSKILWSTTMTLLRQGDHLSAVASKRRVVA